MKENYSEQNLTPKDENNIKNLLNEAKNIISNPNKSNEGKKRELFEKMLKKVLEAQYEKSRNDESVFLTNTRKGTGYEIFYRTLAEEIPELELSFDEKDIVIGGETYQNLIAIKRIPLKTNLDLINYLKDDPIIDLFTFEERPADEKEQIGLKLEKSGLLQEGTTHRLLSKDYNEKIINFPESKVILEKRYAKFKNEKPLSNQEIQEIIRNVIKKEYYKE